MAPQLPLFANSLAVSEAPFKRWQGAWGSVKSCPRVALLTLCAVSRLRRSKRKTKHVRPVVRIGKPDLSSTGLAGLVAIEELIGASGMVVQVTGRSGRSRRGRGACPAGSYWSGWRSGSCPVRTARPGWTGSGLTRPAPC